MTDRLLRRRSSRGGTSSPERIDALISNVIHSSAKSQSVLFAIQRSWAKIAGRELAAHTKPIGLRRGKLVVYVEQPGDAFALNYQRQEILKRIREITSDCVEEIVIRPGRK